MTTSPETDPRTADAHLVPVTLVTGFLGAGKTTLLNRILNDASCGPVAVIVNEFGEAGLDHELIEAVDGDSDVTLMQSGCLCCSIRGDLSETFVKLLLRRKKGMLSFDRIVIETTGLADPGPIMQTLRTDMFLSRNTRLDGVITVVDAVNGPSTMDAQFEAVSQVALADLIVLSKTDLVLEPAAQAVEQRLRTVNPTADIRNANAADVRPQDLWNLTGMRASVQQSDAIAWTTPKSEGVDPLANLSGFAAPGQGLPATTQEFRRHDTDISSVSITLDAPVDDALFDAWFDTLIKHKGRDILRIKGILFLKGLETPFVFHGVQTVFDPPVPLTNWTGDDRRTRIVLIGRNLDRPEIQRSLDMLRDAHSSQSLTSMELLGND